MILIKPDLQNSQKFANLLKKYLFFNFFFKKRIAKMNVKKIVKDALEVVNLQVKTLLNVKLNAKIS